MTGFARVRRAVAQGELLLGLKSVNHRGLDLHFHLPAELDPFENAMRAAIKQRVARGHVQIHLAFNRAALPGCANLNRPLLEAYLSAFQQASRELGLDSTPDLNSALRIPGMFQMDGTAEPDAELEKELLEITGEALDALNRFREREGAALASEMLERCATVCELAVSMEKIRAGATAAFEKRLKDRLADLLRGGSIDPQRLAQEVALLVERSDISEELIRLKTHTEQVQALLCSGGEVGKRLDFLLQEMNRESNTILSKTGGLGELGLTITDLALAAKAELDKIREQSLNLE